MNLINIRYIAFSNPRFGVDALEGRQYLLGWKFAPLVSPVKFKAHWRDRLDQFAILFLAILGAETVLRTVAGRRVKKCIVVGFIYTDSEEGAGIGLPWFGHEIVHIAVGYTLDYLVKALNGKQLLTPFHRNIFSEVPEWGGNIHGYAQRIAVPRRPGAQQETWCAVTGVDTSKGVRLYVIRCRWLQMTVQI